MTYIAFETADGIRSRPQEWRDPLPPYIERAIVPPRPTGPGLYDTECRFEIVRHRKYRIGRQEPIGKPDRRGYFDSYLTIYIEEANP